MVQLLFLVLSSALANLKIS